MKIDIDGHTTPNIYQLTDQAPTLEIYADETFDTSDGQTVLAGSVHNGDFCKRVVCSVASNVLSIPAIEDIDTTEDALTNQQATYSAYIRAAGREPIPWQLQFPLAPITVQGALSVSWATIRIHAIGVIGRRLDADWQQHVSDLIAAAIAGIGEGVVVAKGTAVMAAGEATVTDFHVLSNSIIQLTGQDAGVRGSLFVLSRTPGVGFTINSSDGGDQGDVGWTILAP